jgi:drug/metabolite transporter (DMT)-like permease
MGVFFAILSPAIFGVNNYIEKVLLSKSKISPVVITIYGGLLALLVGLLIIFIVGFYPIDFISLIIILFSGFLTTIYLLPYYKALSLDETSRVIPLFQFYPIFVVCLGYFLLDEKLETLKYLGTLLIIVAGVLISIEKINKKKFKLKPAFFYMLLSSLFFAIAQILYKFGVNEIPFWHTLPLEAFGIALGSTALLFYKNNLKLFITETKNLKKQVFFLITINELFYIAARYTAYYAISLISVSLVSILAGLQPLFVLLYGIILSFYFPNVLRETVTKKIIILKLISISALLLGTAFIFI